MPFMRGGGGGAEKKWNVPNLCPNYGARGIINILNVTRHENKDQSAETFSPIEN